VFLIFAQFLDPEVRAEAGYASVVEDLFNLAAFVFGKSRESRIGVTDGRAKFDGLESSPGQRLNRSGKVFGDHVAHRPGLASDGKAERVGAKLRRGGQHESSGGASGFLSEVSAGNLGHDCLLIDHSLTAPI